MPSPAALYQVGIIYSLSNRMSAALGAITRDMRTAQGQAAITGAEMNRLKTSMIWGGASLLAAGAIVGTMKGLYEAGQKVIDAQTQLGAIVTDATKRQQAYNAAWEATRQVQGVTLSESLLCYSWPAYRMTLRVATLGRRLGKPRGSTAKARPSLPEDGAADDHR